jgi:FdhD protein
VQETALRIICNGRVVGALTCTPEQVASLVVGWLRGLGVLDHADDLLGVEVDGCAGAGDALVADVRLAPDAAAEFMGLLRHRAERGCGPRHFLDCQPGGLTRARGDVAPPSPDAAAGLFEAMYRTAEHYRREGGHHIAALAVEGRIVGCAEDVGRHNAVDKVTGSAWLAGDDLSSAGLVLSSRVSGEIAVKAARAGVAWIASRSVPTTLALEVAARGGTAILARAAGSAPRLFTATAP